MQYTVGVDAKRSAHTVYFLHQHLLHTASPTVIIASDDTYVTAAGNVCGPGMGLQFSITVMLRPLPSVLLSNNACQHNTVYWTYLSRKSAQGHVPVHSSGNKRIT